MSVYYVKFSNKFVFEVLIGSALLVVVVHADHLPVFAYDDVVDLPAAAARILQLVLRELVDNHVLYEVLNAHTVPLLKIHVFDVEVLELNQQNVVFVIEFAFPVVFPLHVARHFEEQRLVVPFHDLETLEVRFVGHLHVVFVAAECGPVHLGDGHHLDVDHELVLQVVLGRAVLDVLADVAFGRLGQNQLLVVQVHQETAVEHVYFFVLLLKWHRQGRGHFGNQVGILEFLVVACGHHLLQVGLQLRQFHLLVVVFCIERCSDDF